MVKDEKLSIYDKIKIIEKSKMQTDIPSECYPKLFGQNYFFISYSHKDYKEVYKDMLLLQEKGINFWYDFGISYGDNWQIIAEDYIKPYRCIGVIFYVSKNSLLSEAIHQEMQYVKKCGKSCITINLPYVDNNGISHNLSAYEMLLAMEKEGEVISNEKKNLIAKLFNKDVLFSSVSEPTDFKATKIKNGVSRPPLFEYRTNNKIIEYSDDENEYQCYSLYAINDIDINQIVLKDFNSFEQEGREKSNITDIDTCAFANCKNLRTIELPSTIESINDYAFYNCSSLESIDLQSIRELGKNAFMGCSSLKQIKFGRKCQLTVLPSYVFFKCSSLKNIKIPDSVSRVGDSAFEGCVKLTKIDLGNGVTEVGYRAFCGCVSLKSVNFSENLKYIGDSMFISCTSLTDITIPFGVTEIGERAFAWCSQLNNVSISESVINIVSGAFISCEKLEKLVLPFSINNIDSGAFSGCSNLFSIEIDERNKVYYSKGNCLIDKNTKDLVLGCYNSVIPQDENIISIGKQAFEGCKLLSQINIPFGVEYIKDAAFKECVSLTKINFPDSLVNIGNYAFSYCVELNSVKIPNGVTTIGSAAFISCYKLEEIEIPKSVVRIQDTAFFECDSLNFINYKGTKSQWDDIDKDLISDKKIVVRCIDGDVIYKPHVGFG